MAFETWQAGLAAMGAGPVAIRAIRRSLAYEEILLLQGNRASDAFDVDLKLTPGGSTLAEFTVVPGSYNADTDQTPLTLTLSAATAALAGVTANTTSYVTSIVFEGLRQPGGSGDFEPFFGGVVQLVEGVADGS